MTTRHIQRADSPGRRTSVEDAGIPPSSVADAGRVQTVEVELVAGRAVVGYWPLVAEREGAGW